MDNTPRVFVVQSTLTERDGQLVPKHDLTPAMRWGRLIELVGPSARPFPDPRGLIEQMRRKLSDYDPLHDHVLLIGNPALIGIATKLAADASRDGSVCLLQWNGSRREYVSIRAELGHDAEFRDVWREK